MHLRSLLVLFLCIAFIQLGSFTVSHSSSQVRNAAPSSGTVLPFDYAVVVVLENQGICDITPSLACGTSNVGPAPYISSLAANYGLAENYTAITHPSLPNYLSLFSGRDWGCQGYDGGPNSNLCTGTAWNSTDANLVDRLEASGLRWKAYMENMTSNCDVSDSGLYAARHDPFVFFKDIAGNPSRCNNIVPALANDTAFLNDLGSPSSASNLMWLTPNLCNDMHDDCTTNSTLHTACDGSGGNVTYCIRQGDSFLSRLVPKILGSPLFQTQRAVLFLTFDEGGGYCPIGSSNRDCVSTILAGPVIKKTLLSSVSYSHFSFLATLDAAWGLTQLTANVTKANPMSEFFTTLFPLKITSSIASPEAGQKVKLNATATGGTGPYTFNWSFGDNTVGTGSQQSHIFSMAGAYTVTIIATDSQSGTASASIMITVTPSPSITFTASLTSPLVGQTITYTASATSGSPPYVFKWDFGDGQFGTGNPISHAYQAAGTFSVQANTTDSVGVTVTQSHAINVSKRSSSITLTCTPSTTIIGETVTCKSTTMDTSSGTASVPTGTVGFVSGVASSSFNATTCTLDQGECSVTYEQTASTTSPTLTATYNGDSTHQTSSGSTSITIGLRETSTVLSCPAQGTVGVPISCEATVIDIATGDSSTPNGTVTLNPSGSCVLRDGTCSINITPSASGMLNASANFSASDSVHSDSSDSMNVDIAPVSSVTNQPNGGPCFFSVCYSTTVWLLIIAGVAIAASALGVFVRRIRARRMGP